MLDRNWLLSWAPLGFLESSQQSWTAIGSGVFVYDGTFIWYVTSHHLIGKQNMGPLHILIRHKNGGRVLFDVQAIHRQMGLEWVIDQENGIAATLFPIDPQYDLKAIGLDLFLP